MVPFRPKFKGGSLAIGAPVFVMPRGGNHMGQQAPGQIVILNGVPRAGKSSIARVIQNTFEGVWINLGVDRYKAMIPDRYQPGLALRPGGEGPALEPIILTMFLALYEAIAAHSRLGLNIVADFSHHDHYSKPLGILPKCAKLLTGLPVLFVGVRCPIEIVLERRLATWGKGYNADGSIPAPVQRFQRDVHIPGIYDLEVDTSKISSQACAALIERRLRDRPSPSAFEQLAST
jgi:chloramphenicol 3-O phosphotransferase